MDEEGEGDVWIGLGTAVVLGLVLVGNGRQDLPLLARMFSTHWSLIPVWHITLPL